MKFKQIFQSYKICFLSVEDGITPPPQLEISANKEMEDMTKVSELEISASKGEENDNQPEPSTSSKVQCPTCHRILSSAGILASHREKYCRYRKGKQAKPKMSKRSATNVVTLNDDDEFVSSSSRLSRQRVSINGVIRDYLLVPNETVHDAVLWMRNEEVLVRRLFDVMDGFIVKGRLVLRAWYLKVNPATGEILRRELFYLSSYPAGYIYDFQQWFDHHVSGIAKNLHAFNDRDSDLVFDGVEALDIKFSLIKNLNAQSYFQLPANLQRMNAVINVDAKEACFKYALLSMLHYNDIKKHRQRVARYAQWEHELNFGDVDINNVNLNKDIRKIENLNNIKINVHVWQNGLKGCRYNRLSTLGPRSINLLLVQNSDGRRHYCGITSLSRLYRHTKTAHNMQHMCDRCCRSFKTRDKLDEHYQWCSQGRLQMETMPKNKHFSYTTLENELSPLKVVYADIESYIQQDIHYPAAIASYEVWHAHFKQKQANTKINSWVGEKSISDFLQYLEDSAIRQHHRDYKMTRQAMLLTTQQEKDFLSCQYCPRCNVKFDKEKHIKVRDHCHITGKYRSPLCRGCNFRLKQKRRTLPVVFHNFKNYDSHMIIKHGIGERKHWKLSIIPQTTEKYMSLRADIPVDKTREGKTVYFSVVFIDSYQFMASSLANLVNNLDRLPFTETIKNDFPNLSDEAIKRKGVFPYSYLDSMQKLQESSLPPRDAFRNDLTGEACSEDDYRFAQKVWQEFDCRTFHDFMLCYLKVDVLQLADVFEKFRGVSLEQDGLDPVHFVSLPALSYQSAFKMTGERIDLIQDAEMYTFFERGIRGGLTFVNKHVVRSEIITIDNKQYIIRLVYIDQNNLYGSSLCKPLPHSEFAYVADVSLLTRDFILNIDEGGEWGYTLEVNLHYPTQLHQHTADFPLAPESGTVTADMFSPFMTYFHNLLTNNAAYKSSRKLLLTHFDKEKYVVHYSILKFYLKMGLELTKVHRAVKYKQKAWLKPYIEYNSKQRKQATNNFEKDFYKLKNNALFGKTMEDVRKRINYKLVSDEEKMTKLISSPFFHSRDIISEDIVGVHMLKPKVILNKPIFVGQAVLDYSKLEMYELFYKTLPQCPLIKKLQLVGGDTDSFFLTIATDIDVTLSDVFNSLAQHIDTSNYPPSHPLYSVVNKAKLGCFKDETGGRMLEEMILLRPKMYSMKFKDSDTSIKRAKGISKHIVKNMKHDLYREAFEEKKTTRVQMTIIRSKQHSVQTTTFNKRALSAWEDKRVWLSENESLPHGHVYSPVSISKRRRVMLPPSGDVD